MLEPVDVVDVVADVTGELVVATAVVGISVELVAIDVLAAVVPDWQLAEKTRRLAARAIR